MLVPFIRFDILTSTHLRSFILRPFMISKIAVIFVRGSKDSLEVLILSVADSNLSSTILDKSKSLFK